MLEFQILRWQLFPDTKLCSPRLSPRGHSLDTRKLGPEPLTQQPSRLPFVLSVVLEASKPLGACLKVGTTATLPTQWPSRPAERVFFVNISSWVLSIVGAHCDTPGQVPSLRWPTSLWTSALPAVPQVLAAYPTGCWRRSPLPSIHPQQLSGRRLRAWQASVEPSRQDSGPATGTLLGAQNGWFGVEAMGGGSCGSGGALRLGSRLAGSLRAVTCL